MEQAIRPCWRTLYHRLARDLPTARLAMTQHYSISQCILPIAEPGEGWPLAWSSAFDVSTIVRLGSFARHRSDGLTGSNQPWRSRVLRAADDESVPNQDERPNTGAVITISRRPFKFSLGILSEEPALASCVSSMFPQRNLRRKAQRRPRTTRPDSASSDLRDESYLSRWRPHDSIHL
jgi:hypothetical protein